MHFCTTTDIHSPQSQPAAITHLCSACEVTILFYDETYSDLARSASAAASFDLNCQILPWQKQHLDIYTAIKAENEGKVDHLRAHTQQDVAYLFHTSGTSTGLPKPIPQSHHAAVGVLPSLDGKESATFTTTPLYHGGIADCLRSWTSSALIWLFPGARVPITPKNILFSIACAQAVTRTQKIAPISYFASVPYILQMLAEEENGMDLLREMKIVSVGGAALPQSVGDRLVDQGVNLVSRFGSAECGFLLSSHRVYKQDKEWQYLRLAENTRHLHFEEEHGTNLSQLIVLSTWPHVAKTNRPDGSFATSDLFEQHSSLPNAWRYHSRNDSQITLSTGKKFDPAPLEDLISSSSPLIRDVLIFGNGKQVPGVLVFPASASNQSDVDLETTIWTVIEEINSGGQDHTRIRKDMIIVMSQDEEALSKSSKGTVLRNIAGEKYAKQIEVAYEGGNELHDQSMLSYESSKKAVLDVVRQIVRAVSGSKGALDDESDFYRHGVDSAMCSQIRGRLTKATEPGIQLPWSVVYDCGNITA